MNINKRGGSTGEIEGMFCNWAIGDGSVGGNPDRRQDLVQKQVIEQDAVDNIFKVVSSNITYSPDRDCNYSQAEIDDGFVYDGDASREAFTNNLVDPSDIGTSGFVLPTAPTAL